MTIRHEWHEINENAMSPWLFGGFTDGDLHEVKGGVIVVQ